MAITLFGTSANPGDNVGLVSLSEQAITPPDNMQSGDLVILTCGIYSTDLGATVSITDTGGQTWTTLGLVGDAAYYGIRVFHCVFNGTWSSSPALTRTNGTYDDLCMVMNVFRGFLGWEVDNAFATTTYAAPGSPYNVTRTGVTTTKPNAIVFAGWISKDDNTWALQTAGWANAGLAQYRTPTGSDMSFSLAYTVIDVAGASGDVVNQQTANGGDAGATFIISFAGLPKVSAVPFVSTNSIRLISKVSSEVLESTSSIVPPVATGIVGSVLAPAILEITGSCAAGEVIDVEAEFEFPAFDMEASTGAHAEFELPFFSLEAEGSAQIQAEAELTFPAFDLEAHTGAQAEITFPSFEMETDATLHGLLQAEMTLPALSLECNVNAEHVLDCQFNLPAFEFEADTGAHAEFNLPLFQLEADSTAGAAIDASVTLPMFQLECEVFPGLLAEAEITFPAFSLEAHTGTQAEITFPAFTMESDAKAYKVLDCEFTLPFFELESNIEADTVMECEMTLPAFIIEASSIQSSRFTDYILRHSRW